MKDIENNEAITTDNVDENAKKQFLKGAEVAYEQMNEGDIGDLDAKKRLEGIRKILIA